MQRITPGDPWLLHDIAATRRIEAAAAAARPAPDLMQRAGLATARLAMAIAPHARRVWVACGPGNNGGDGLEAAMHLHQWGREVVASLAGDPSRLPADARAAHARAAAAGVTVGAQPPSSADLVIDAMLGIGGSRPLEGVMAQWLDAMASMPHAPVLSIDVPSGLDADTGHRMGVTASHTLSLLTLKPGLFTARGRDAAGRLWFDDLGVDATGAPAVAVLNAQPVARARAHASHKGSFGDVAVVGGAAGMTGAAMLAARAALHGGAGRVFVGLLSGGVSVDATQPELMLRDAQTLHVSAMAVACGCGGGQAVAPLLPRLLGTALALVLDADALNAVAADPHLQSLLQARAGRAGWSTVLTPHPLEAARLLRTSTQDVQADRLGAAQRLCARLPGAVIVLKGSGTIIALQGREPVINTTGNARLATAGTGDVLAGLLAARLASGEPAFTAACAAVYLHGVAADRWPSALPLTAGALAQRC
jgi:hydroxyethylthiazole kinase-like uncharacterized protein yjeF